MYSITTTTVRIEDFIHPENFAVVSVEVLNTARTLINCFSDKTEDNRISAIKFIKTMFGLDLKTAKIVIDAVSEETII